MDFLQIGLNHRTAPLEVREKVYLDKKKKEKIAAILNKKDYIEEFFFLSTCNRTEFYVLADEQKKAEEIIISIIKDMTGLKKSKLLPYLYFNYEMAVIKHFYRVGAGLDSLIIGESQIINQIKDEYDFAKKMNITGCYFNQLFTEGIRVSKKVRSETSINQGAASVSYAAVELAREVFGSLSGEKVMILGAGETSELVLKNLVSYGVQGILVANRTYSNGKKLANKYGGRVINWENVADYINKVDIIIASTAAPHLVLNKESDRKILKSKKGPLFMIDIAVPRDINPDFKDISGIHLYNIDDLKEIVNKNIELRKKETDKAEKIINNQLDKYKSWLKERRCVPIIKNMRSRAKKIEKKEVARARHRLEKSDDTASEVVEDLAHRLVNKLLHQPTVSIKEMAKKQVEEEDIELVKKVLLKSG